MSDAYRLYGNFFSDSSRMLTPSQGGGIQAPVADFSQFDLSDISSTMQQVTLGSSPSFSFSTPALSTTISPSISPSSFVAPSFSSQSLTSSLTPFSTGAGMDFMSPFQSAPQVQVAQAQQPTGRFTQAFENQILSEISLTPTEMLFQPAAPADQAFQLPAGVVTPSGRVGVSLLDQTAETTTPTSITGGMTGNLVPSLAQTPGPGADVTMGQVGRDYLRGVVQSFVGRESYVDPETGKEIPITNATITVPPLVGPGGAPIVAKAPGLISRGVQYFKGLGPAGKTITTVSGTGSLVYGGAEVTGSIRESRATEAQEKLQANQRLDLLNDEIEYIQTKSDSIKDTLSFEDKRAVERTLTQLNNQRQSAELAIQNKQYSLAAPDIETQPLFTQAETILRTELSGAKVDQKNREIQRQVNQLSPDNRNTFTPLFKENKLPGAGGVQITDPEILKSMGIPTDNAGNVSVQNPGQINASVTRYVRTDPQFANLSSDEKTLAISHISSVIEGNNAFVPSFDIKNASVYKSTENQLSEVDGRITTLESKGVDVTQLKNELGFIRNRIDPEYLSSLPLEEAKSAVQAIAGQVNSLVSKVSSLSSSELPAVDPEIKKGMLDNLNTIVTGLNSNPKASKEGVKIVQAEYDRIKRSFEVEFSSLERKARLRDPATGLPVYSQAEIEIETSDLIRDTNRRIEEFQSGSGPSGYGALGNISYNPVTGEQKRNVVSDIQFWGSVTGFISPFLMLWLNREEAEAQRDFDRSMMYEKAQLEQKYWMEKYGARVGSGGVGGSGGGAAPTGRTDIPLVNIPR